MRRSNASQGTALLSLSLENAIVQKCIFNMIFVVKLVKKQQNFKPAFH